MSSFGLKDLIDKIQSFTLQDSTPASGQTTPLSGISRASTPESGPKLPDEIDMVTPANHLDFSVILPLFPNLVKMVLCFQTKKCGIDFRWNMFGMTEKDADNIANGIAHCHKLEYLSIREASNQLLTFKKSTQN